MINSEEAELEICTRIYKRIYIILLDRFKNLIFGRDLLQVAELKGKEIFHSQWVVEEKKKKTKTKASDKIIYILTWCYF